MGLHLYFHILVSDHGVLEPNTWINQTKRCQRGQRGTAATSK